MSPTIIVISSILFWSLALLSIALPPRSGVVAFILLVQFDLTGTAFYADSSVGWQNAVKIVVIPTVLLLRLWPLESLPAAFAWVRNCWILFVSYAILAIGWSPYRLSAIKLVAYLYCYSAVFMIFLTAWRRRWFSEKSFITIVLLALSFAVVQTYALGNFYGDPEYGSRFTTFSGAQSFAPFLICIAILLFMCVKRTALGLLAAGLAVTGLILVGSRSYLMGLAWVLLVCAIASAKRLRRNLTLGVVLKSVSFGAIVIALLLVVSVQMFPKNRLNELVDVAFSRNPSIQDVETFAWRVTIWVKAIDDISSRSWPQFLIGSGTSSGATVGIETGYFEEESVDPNRCVHDEFIRCLYEWGLPGVLSFTCMLALLLRLSFKLARLTQAREAWACLAVLGALLIGLLIENILADGASPGGIGYCLVLSSMVARLRPATLEVRTSRGSIALRPVGMPT